MKKSGDGKDVTCFECKDPGHYENECPKMRKDKPKNKEFRGKKKGMIATWDKSESLRDDFEKEQVNVALMAST